MPLKIRQLRAELRKAGFVSDQQREVIHFGNIQIFRAFL